jgi:hypothetical protein
MKKKSKKKERAQEVITGTPHRFPPAPENARQLSEPRTVRSREGWVRFAHSKGYDWSAPLRANFAAQPSDKCFFTLQDCLAGGFSWSKSPEGYMFWREVYREAGGQINTDLIAQRVEAELVNQLNTKHDETEADHLGI